MNELKTRNLRWSPLVIGHSLELPTSDAAVYLLLPGLQQVTCTTVMQPVLTVYSSAFNLQFHSVANNR